ncbi:MAG: DUF445 family protein [Oscillospiraceae bacterium]|nr:DUF445 family protein [Oscillospiraceae bacterium]
MELLRTLAGPIIGAVIGYLTNFIAVKMLFYPRKEIRLFGLRLPLTPGAIPRGRTRLAAAIGAVVENNLLTREDMETRLLSEETEQKIADTVMEKLSGVVRESICTAARLDGASYEEKKGSVCREAGRRIVDAIQASQATETVMNEISASLLEKAQGTAWKLLISPKTVAAVTTPAKERLDRFVAERGADLIAPFLERELTAADSGTGLELLGRFGVDEAKLRAAVVRTYRGFVTDYVGDLLTRLHVAKLVEDKINAMPLEELERLVQKVMHRELNAIVNLGALIGLVLGLVNVFLK